MKKILLLLSFLISFFLVSPVFAFSYSRNPAGTDGALITSPVTINFSWIDCADLEGQTPQFSCPLSSEYWGIRLYDYINEPNTQFNPDTCYIGTQNSGSFIFNIPVGKSVNDIEFIIGSSENNCITSGSDYGTFEYQVDFPLKFTIISGGGSSLIPNPIIPNLTIGSTSDFFATASALVTGIWLIIAIAIGVPMGIWIVYKIMDLMPPVK
jgi:hypothetical protein